MRQKIVEDVKTKLQRSGLPIDAIVIAKLLDVHRSSTCSNKEGEQNDEKAGMEAVKILLK
uniref:Uncharacterized protein n=1 Tax=Solanum lycopersicum TaxID=4081 RepID=A0A3Q7HM97_SOLLC